MADRGPGIPPDEQEQIFDPFFRGSRAVQDQVHGTGLGLSLVKKIVEAARRQHSRGKQADEGGGVYSAHPRGAGWSLWMSARILLVEDELGVALTLSDLLQGEGYEVETSGDGPGGLARATSEAFDLVVLDVMLPGKNGLEVCKELRQRGKDIAILMLTAKSPTR